MRVYKCLVLSYCDDDVMGVSANIMEVSDDNVATLWNTIFAVDGAP